MSDLPGITDFYPIGHTLCDELECDRELLGNSNINKEML